MFMGEIVFVITVSNFPLWTIYQYKFSDHLYPLLGKQKKKKRKKKKKSIYIYIYIYENIHYAYKHRNPKTLETMTTLSWFRHETFIYLFEFKFFRYEERETHNFFLCCLFHLNTHHVRHIS